MPTGPKGQKRPADVIGNAVKVMRIATGEISDPRCEDGPDKEKNPRAVAAGRLGGEKGGKRRAQAMTQEERSAVAKRAAQARWKRD